ncbi:MAG TPA: hypothetical protein VE078_17015 [Thermoanaerobaculia bacterium]|nr:hypothetical protein [Thermoanaerobaculia bacterium]
MRRRILTASAALILLLSLSAAPADASAFGTPNRQIRDFQDLVNWASSWFTGLWDADGDRGANLDPDGQPTPGPGDPLPPDDRGANLDPDG